MSTTKRRVFSDRARYLEVMMLRQLCYLSRADAAISDQDVRQILRVAQRNNCLNDITGCLLYSGRHFVQILEGDTTSLDEVLVRIRKDPRHHDLVVAVDQEVLTRRFPNWSMGILYKLDIVDRVEALLAANTFPETAGFELFDEVDVDTVMGSL